MIKQNEISKNNKRTFPALREQLKTPDWMSSGIILDEPEWRELLKPILSATDGELSELDALLEIAEEGDIEFIEWYAQKNFGLDPGEWFYFIESLKETEKYWRLAHRPLHYVEKITHKKKTWAKLDVDNVSHGRFYPGSLFRKRKDKRNKSPRGIVSLDVITDMENRRAENDKEAWLDNDGILEYEKDKTGSEIMSPHEFDNMDEFDEPYETEKGKLKEWNREAKYIQRKFLDGYNTETFTMQDEQEKFIMTSFIPRLKRNKVDYNLRFPIEDDSIARVDIELSVKRAGLGNDDVKVSLAMGMLPSKEYYRGAGWNQYRPGYFKRSMTKQDIYTLFGLKLIILWKPINPDDIKLFLNGYKHKSLKDGKVIYENQHIVAVKGKCFVESFLSRDITGKMPYRKLINTGKWDERKVEASMKRIRRAVENKKLYY